MRNEEGGGGGYDDDDDDYEEKEDDDDASASDGNDDMHENMHGLLKDLNMFRRKIGDDKTRFVDELSRRRPLGVRTNIF
ncbi:hypothetical protein B0T17DRAFT_539767 [Bombardia bombarda]|uniref:Uncharacterized protein n=1 Tax=Bombardia bombarda TaxID=252184 RepID=A0AA39WID9_9PEZI|nr:hypothetical protein B0T17DRAFT_539767 [Bombardia bombarda]